MLATRSGCKRCFPKRAARLGPAVIPLFHAKSSVLGNPAGLGAASVSCLPITGPRPRYLSVTSASRLRELYPVKDTACVRQTEPTWRHPGYTEEQLLSIKPEHRKPQDWADWWAWKTVRFARRWAMDWVTGVKSSQQVDKTHPTTAVAAYRPLTEKQWLVRIIFLESIAGVPGMVAGMLRHFRSVRTMKRDNSWMETLLEEAFNERMHLLTFMKMCEPGWFMRELVLPGAQGVFATIMIATYMVSPKVAHRFVGYLEEEAVHTYTRCVRELELGLLPKWCDPNFQIPDIAIDYWHMPEGKRTMRDLILYVRADEAGHRGVNHTLGNLNADDPNPFVSDSRYKDHGSRPSPIARLEYKRADVIGESALG